MNLTRIMGVLATALVIMLAVVVLRAETTRIHYEISELERRDDVLRQELRREKLAWQQARNPTELLERVKSIWLCDTEGERPGTSGG